MSMGMKKPVVFSLYIALLVSTITADCECERENKIGEKHAALRLKIVAIASILAAGALGVFLPIFSRSLPSLSPEKDVFFIIKAFAAGVILATGFIHILPDAFESLTSPCLKENPWGKFPFAGFVAMLSAIGSLMVDAFATGYYTRSHQSKSQYVQDEIEAAHLPAHTHGTHGHSHGAVGDAAASGHSLIRNRVISHVLELGIVVHSVIVGISLGASENTSTVRPLVAALSFHQFFEGMGLGGCVVQADFKIRLTIVMAVFFSLTTPMGIAVGIGISSGYDENSPTALIVEGVLNSASAGILIYMALVDLLAADYMNPKIQNNVKLLFWVNLSLLFGAGCMALMAKWA